MVRLQNRRGARVLVIDISYRAPDGTKARYRRDAEVQTRAAAFAEERRRLAAVASKGSPFALVDEMVDAVQGELASLPILQFTAARMWDRRDVDRRLLTRLGTLDFMAAGRNVVFVGAPGTGKTHLAIGLGVRACQAGHRVLFATAWKHAAWL